MATYAELKADYNENFSLKYVGKNIQQKLALISLLGYLVQKQKEKKPDVTYYQVIMKLDPTLANESAVALAIVAEDFAYGCTEFPTFGVEDKNIIKTLRDILKDWLPF